MNFIGVVAALTAFFSIWLGHVAVRKIEFVSRTIWIPSTIFASFGIVCVWTSLITTNLQLASIFGILGITFLFDAFEFTRQQRRVQKGHAPTNPNNPRHAAFLAVPSSQAITIDLLKREPIGHTIGFEESIQLIKNH